MYMPFIVQFNKLCYRMVPLSLFLSPSQPQWPGCGWANLENFFQISCIFIKTFPSKVIALKRYKGGETGRAGLTAGRGTGEIYR